MFGIDDVEPVCPVYGRELDLVNGSNLFSVLRFCKCGSLYPLGNYFPEIPDPRSFELRNEIFEKTWFRVFGVEYNRRYSKDIDRRMIELPYYIAFLREDYSTKYSSRVEQLFLEEFRRIIGNGRILSIGSGDGRELRLLGRNGLGIDILPSNIIMSNSLGVRSILADVLYLPFREDVFDGVLAIQSLEYISLESTRRALSEIRRVLKPSGIVLFSLEKTPDSRGIDREFNYVYEDEYIIVKKHFRGGWGRIGLRYLNEMFKIIGMSEDEDYYYVLVEKPNLCYTEYFSFNTCICSNASFIVDAFMPLLDNSLDNL